MEWGEQVDHLRIVLQILKDQELYYNINKCEFLLRFISSIGHVASWEGIQVNPQIN